MCGKSAQNVDQHATFNAACILICRKKKRQNFLSVSITSKCENQNPFLTPCFIKIENLDLIAATTLISWQ